MATDEWQTRTLCDDGACTGLIGADGCCRVCGKVAPYWGDERRRGQLPDDDDGDEADGESDGDQVDRELCPDGACTGVVGDDGACGVCGARPDGAAQVVAVVPPTVAAASDDDDAHRRLCPDGSCIGLLDAAGVCKVCGQADVGN